MAHVKVVRRSMRPEEWTDLRFVWLQRGIYEEKFEITDLEIRDARQISEDQYEYYSDEYRPLKKDDMYFTPDGTAFIRGHVQIPAHMKGKNIYFTLHTAAEMIVKLMESMLAALTRTVNASCLIHILILTILQLRLKHITVLSRMTRETLLLLHIVAAARSSRELIFQLSVIMYSLLFMTISYLWISLTASILMKTTANFCSVN